MRQSYFGVGMRARIAASDFFKQCMVAKGWTPG